MARDLTRRYIWLIDLLSRRGPLTREEINVEWLRSSFSDGNPIPPRTFFHFRRAIEENLDIEILCDRNHRYYIEGPQNRRDRNFRNWLLDSYSVSRALSSTEGANRIVLVEDVPSAREWLSDVIQAIRHRNVILFSYKGYTRSRIDEGIRFRPYLVKLYKQRWYMLGLQERSNEMRTYALDRIVSLQVLDEKFPAPKGEDPAELFDDIIGITSSKAEKRKVVLKVMPDQAKYLRALPLHHSQAETFVADGYSIFEYNLKLNYELVHELLGFGENVTVVEPKELKIMVKDQIEKMRSNYDSAPGV